MGINLLTFNQKTVAPKDDALIQQYALGQDGFFYGGTPTYTGGNTIHFQSGEGMMCGREFVLEDTDVSAALPASGTLLGQVYIHIDLSNTDNPIELICETAETLTELTKDENLNVNNGTYDLQLCTFTANVSNITDLVSQIKQIKKGGGGSDENLAQIEDGTEATRAYVAGEFVVVDGLLRKVLAPIAIGDEFEDDVNEEITNVGAQITALNQNLTNSLTLDYSQSALPSTTTFNEFAQMVLEKLYPKATIKWLYGSEYTPTHCAYITKYYDGRCVLTIKNTNVNEMGTIPTGYKPQATITVSHVYYYYSAGNNYGTLIIYSNGTMTFKDSAGNENRPLPIINQEVTYTTAE